ncbi:MAG: portal protein [Candidatus Hodarchaeales archaeon]
MNYKDQYGSLVAERQAGWDNIWEKVGKLIYPNSGSFNSTNVEGDQLNFNFDNTGNRAAQRFVTMLFSQLTPRSTRWHGLKGEGGTETKADQVTDEIFKYRYLPDHGFSQAILQCMMSVIVFGNGFLFLEEDKVLGGTKYINVPLNDMYIDIDFNRNLTKVFRKMYLTKEQAKDLFPKNIPAEVTNSKQENEKFLFVHCVHKNTDRAVKKRGFLYKSVYLYGGASFSTAGSEVDLKIISTGYFVDMPYIYGQLLPAYNEKYARGIGVDNFSDLATLDELSRLLLKKTTYNDDPVIGTTDDDIMWGSKFSPGEVVPGLLNSEGELLIKPIPLASDVDLSANEIARRTQAVLTAFNNNAFQIFSQDKTQSATEVMQRSSESSVMLAPFITLLQDSFLSKVIKRELNILSRQGLIELPSGLSLYFDAPANRLMESERVLGVVKMLNILMPLFQINPQAIAEFNDRIDVSQMIKTLGVSLNVPQDLIFDDAKVKTAQDKRKASISKNKKLQDDLLQSQIDNNSKQPQ